jgi:hypothetical protein
MLRISTQLVLTLTVLLAGPVLGFAPRAWAGYMPSSLVQSRLPGDSLDARESEGMGTTSNSFPQTLTPLPSEKPGPADPRLLFGHLHPLANGSPGGTSQSTSTTGGGPGGTPAALVSTVEVWSRSATARLEVRDDQKPPPADPPELFRPPRTLV